jgi:hypothetical protein
MNILIVEKTGNIKETKIKNPDEIYKKCGFKSAKDFEHKVTWGTVACNEKINIKLFAKETGRANSENKYEFPPPVDTELYFGSVALLAFSEDDEILDLYKETWETIYEELYGGFEDLGSEDSDETDELEDVPAEMKTKEGYLKDGFVVPDDNLLDDVVEEDEVEVDVDEEAEVEFDGDALTDSDSDSDEDSELSEEDYYYSD